MFYLIASPDYSYFSEEYWPFFYVYFVYWTLPLILLIVLLDYIKVLDLFREVWHFYKIKSFCPRKNNVSTF